jgi:hypothetical protein
MVSQDDDLIAQNATRRPDAFDGRLFLFDQSFITGHNYGWHHIFHH